MTETKQSWKTPKVEEIAEEPVSCETELTVTAPDPALKAPLVLAPLPPLPARGAGLGFHFVHEPKA